VSTAADHVTADWRTFAPGERVVVRRRRDDHPGAGEPPLTDVLGEVVRRDDDGLTVATRHGDVHVPAADVVLAKRVPPPPTRRTR
jgi:hypothetical protein